MNRALTLLAGAGLGAGLMYLLDPEMGRRRRALTRDKLVGVAHQVENTAGVVARDMKNRAHGLASGDLSVLAGGRRALAHPLRGSWSPSARTLMTLLGGSLLMCGLTRSFPTSCVLGTAGLGLAAEGFTNAGIDDISRIPHKVADAARSVAGRLTAGRNSAPSSAHRMNG